MRDIRTIICHVDSSPECATRLAAARDIGQWAGAQVIGLYATTSTFVALPFAVAESSAAGQMALQMDEDDRTRARAMFDEVAATSGGSLEWSQLSVADVPIYGVAQRAYFSDLLVLGQHKPGAPRNLPLDFVESVIADSGQPALVMPYAWDGTTVGSRVLVAWKQTRDAARALHASMPFLQRAATVDIVAWQESLPTATEDREHLARYLKSHGVTPTFHWFGSAPRDVGESLLSLTADLQSDLLVMGCYGHSRARELMLGGVSRTVLRSMTVPVLMSH